MENRKHDANRGEVLGYVHSLESFGSADGPGVRYVIFLSGCDMRCQFCHNPDTWKKGAGTPYRASDLIEKAWRYRSYWGQEGGITVSGGEPLLQIDFLLELFSLAREKGIHTVLDTSGNPFSTEEPFYSKWKKLMKMTDLVMLDIKHMDEEGHRQLTGQPGENIRDMAREMSDLGQPMWIRHVLVPGRTDSDGQLQALADFVGTLKTVERVEVLPYHTLGVFKWENLGIPYPLEGVAPPSPERVAHARAILKEGRE